eukprot:CAMPEP_0194217260 /NCGR_PEP_ID=MMETSP0156-20130528/20788_1 /TAXON_ID=33649 /ORGANISM="Thalassionema nitzschioides, Strain L26-B" /LENGTH=287 /DNA_ID=CAMNT_0038946253 /DNA_START=91 /DNA_END=954 /DNA_ORIENTATION=-
MDNIESIETINVMKQQEKMCYLTESGIYDQSTAIDGEWRRLMVGWCMQVCDFCQFDRRTVFIAINILDRFVARKRHILNNDTDVVKNQFQLAAMACLYTSVKIHEPLAIDPGSMSKLSKGAFSAQEIEEMEFKILETIGWRVNTPTAASFAEIFLKLLPAGLTNSRQEKIIEQLIQCQISHATTDCTFLGMPASELAFTAAYNATVLTVGLSASEAYQEIQQAIYVKLLPLEMENDLIACMQNSDILADAKPCVASTPKEQQRKQSSGNSIHLDSPRCIAMPSSNIL